MNHPTQIAAGAFLLATLNVLIACSDGRQPTGEPTASSRVGGLDVRLWLDPDPPKQQGLLWLELRDEDGGAVDAAQVDVGWLMPAMGAMPEMKGKAEIEEVGSGLYRAQLDLPMNGSWTLPVNIRTSRTSVIAEYTLNVGSAGLREVGARALNQGSPEGVQPPTAEYPQVVLDALRETLRVYEEVRTQLTQDRMDGLSTRAERLAQSFVTARSALGNEGAPAILALVDEGERSSSSLAAVDDLETARVAFGEVSRSLFALAAADPRLVEGWQSFSCPMTSTFPRWMQPAGELENPYMGQAMPGCGSPADWSLPQPEGVAELEAHAQHVHGGLDEGDEIAHYTCSMHPSVKRGAAGTCPICAMDLVGVTRREVETGTFVVSAERRQQIGVRTEAVGTQAMNLKIRAVGRVTYDETLLSEVTVKVGGFVGRLSVDQTGQLVRQGEVLFELYSPELYASQEELLAALASQQAARSTQAPDRADYLVDAARQRLRLWDLSESQIEAIAESGQPLRDLPILSSSSGYVVEKMVVQGSSINPGQTLYRIAGLDRVWIEAEVYESDLSLIEVGQLAEISLPYLGGKRFEGRVAFVYPYLRAETRTGTVRIALANPGLELKPEMYADVSFAIERGERLTVAEEAVLYAGERRLVFVDLGEGRLQPREVEIGVRAGDRYEVLAGLEMGERVVVSGNFLIAAESRLKSATEKW